MSSPSSEIAFVALAFVFAGFVKGGVGIGLPTVVMGLLCIAMPPAQAAPLMVLPAIATNIWQMLAGPALLALLKRYAAMLVAIFAGTFMTIGLMTRTGAWAQAILGAVLAVYGAYGLWGRRFHFGPRTERWLSPVTGLLTGMLSGATGVFVVPTVPYLTSLRMTTEEFVQSVGILAFACPLALAIALSVTGHYRAEAGMASLLAVLPSLIGLYAGQKLRRRLPAATFMRWFFIAVIALGGYTALRTLKG